MDWLEAAGLFAAAFVAGAINAVAGGGSLISFPALLAAGYPAKSANVTNTVALVPGYVGGSLGYRAELADQGRRLLRLAVPAMLGGLAGAVLLLTTPQSAFEVIVPFLILAACILMALQDRLSVFTERHRGEFADGEAAPQALLVSTFFLGVYGAYFGAALGIMTLAVFSILIADNIQRLNALKGMTSLIINAVAVVWFALFGPVAWGAAAVMAVGALGGGYLGVGVARRLGRDLLRGLVIGYGLIVVAVLLAQLAF